MSRTGHAGNSGLQSHSVGELYPYSIVVIDRAGCGVCQGRNLITGEIVCNVRYNNNGPAGSFESAHRAAEFHCAVRKGEDDEAGYRAAEAAAAAQSAHPEISAELTVCRLILPIVRESDGERHSDELWDYTKKFFCDVFGGFTCRNVTGGWCGPDGKVICDSSIEFEAAGNADAVTTLISRASGIARSFDQVCVYVAIGATARLHYSA